MLDCAECGAPVDGGRCHVCGHVDKTASHASHATVSYLCAAMPAGRQCGKYGSISSATNGSGPWLCVDHHPFTKGGGKLDFSASSITSLAELAARYKPQTGPKEVDIEAEAERFAIQNEPTEKMVWDAKRKGWRTVIDFGKHGRGENGAESERPGR